MGSCCIFGGATKFGFPCDMSNLRPSFVSLSTIDFFGPTAAGWIGDSLTGNGGGCVDVSVTWFRTAGASWLNCIIVFVFGAAGRYGDLIASAEHFAGHEELSDFLRGNVKFGFAWPIMGLSFVVALLFVVIFTPSGNLIEETTASVWFTLTGLMDSKSILLSVLLSSGVGYWYFGGSTMATGCRRFNVFDNSLCNKSFVDLICASYAFGTCGWTIWIMEKNCGNRVCECMLPQMGYFRTDIHAEYCYTLFHTVDNIWYTILFVKLFPLTSWLLPKLWFSFLSLWFLSVTDIFFNAVPLQISAKSFERPSPPLVRLWFIAGLRCDVVSNRAVGGGGGGGGGAAAFDSSVSTFISISAQLIYFCCD